MGGAGGGRENWGGGGDSRIRKLKMPVFDGEDAHGWIYWVERYFAVNVLTEEERLADAILCLEGKALAGYKWRDMRDQIRSWREFKDCLLEYFRTSREEDFYEKFFALVQEGIVMDYREKFEYLFSRLGRLSKTILEGNFMKGLKSEIRAGVVDAVWIRGDRGVSTVGEDKNLLEKGNWSNRSGAPYWTTTTFLSPKVQPVAVQKEPFKDRGVGAWPAGNFKELTETEL